MQNKASLDNEMFSRLLPSTEGFRLTAFSAVSEHQRYISQIAVNVDRYNSSIVTLAKRTICEKAILLRERR